MAVTTRACIGRSTSTETSAASDKPCIITNLNSAEPWFPSTALEVSSTSNFVGVRTVEIFWFVNSTTVNTDRIISCRNQVSGAEQLTLVFSTSTSISWIFADSNGTQRTISTTISLAGNTAVWWHSVLYKDTNTDTWQARHGRVGLTRDGLPSTADTWSQYLANTTQTQGIANDDRLRGLRPSNTNNTFICMGGFISALSGNTVASVSSTTSLKGGYGDLRVWSDNRGMIESGSGDSPFDLRDQYIDGTQFPTLLHCFRFNEPNGTAVTDFDDVGVKNARFMSAVSSNPVGFASSPIPSGAVTTLDKFGSYKVSSNPFAFKSGDYGVEVVPRSVVTRSGTYKVSSNPDKTVSGDYAVLSTASKSVSGNYSILRNDVSSRFGTYAIASVAAPDTITKTGAYKVLNVALLSKSGTYEIVSLPQKSVLGTYKVAESPSPFSAKLGVYKVQATGTEIAKFGDYAVSGTATISVSGSYRIAGQSTFAFVARAGRYAINNPNNLGELAIKKLAELRSRTR